MCTNAPKTPAKRPNDARTSFNSPNSPPHRLCPHITEDQATDAQVDELKAASCRLVHQELGSVASRSRSVLAKLV
jgi:hypothetical protein